MASILKRAGIFLLMAIWTLTAATASHAAARVVPFSGYTPGTIVVKTHDRRLFYVLAGNRALMFPVGVGRAGMQWTGLAHIDGKYVKPSWRAPPSINHGGWGPVIPGGSPRNPMGIAAMTVRDGVYAIHGTNNPSSVGRFISHGCIRMYNRDIAQLFPLVSVGAPVYVER
jgi:lipoprotein-anchoring transpeptidase ErfK/SrfK